MTDARTIFTFVVPGRAVPKERARKGKGGRFYTPKRTKVYEAEVAWCAVASGLRLKPRDVVMLELEFHLCPMFSGDNDNRIHAIQDGLQRAYPGWNDRHVAYVSGRQVRAPNKREQRTVVCVEVLA